MTVEILAADAALGTSPAPIDAHRAAADDFARRSKSEGTVALYRREWERFHAWCMAHGVQALPASVDDARAYVAHLAEHLSVATINVAVAAISQVHQAAGEASPTRDPQFRATWRGVRHVKGVAPRRKKGADLVAVKKSIQASPAGIAGLRDRALMLFAFASSMRRSEIAALDVADLAWVPRGLEVTIRRAKQDQEGRGRTIPLVYGDEEGGTCPLLALRAWLDAAGIVEGPAFRSVDRHGRVGAGRLDGGSVARILKRSLERVDEDGDWGGHSTRRGSLSAMAAADVPEYRIRAHSGHSSSALYAYIEEGRRFVNPASGKLGL